MRPEHHTQRNYYQTPQVTITQLHSIFYKYNSYSQIESYYYYYKCGKTSMATAIQYNIIKAGGRVERRPEMETDPFCMSGSQGQPVPLNWGGTGCP